MLKKLKSIGKKLMNVLLDHPLILSVLFYPRPAAPNSSRDAAAYDGTLPAANPDVTLGYRFYPHSDPSAPVLVFWHGNGENATDYDGLAPTFHSNGAALLVLDYRGYGWSTGEPRGSALLDDAEAVADVLPDVLASLGVAPDAPLYAYGRSLGSAPAIHAAYTYPHLFKGLILDSAFAHAPTLFASLALPWINFNGMPDPFDNEAKIARIDLPLVVIHGDNDQLIPVSHGQRLYDLSPAAYKKLLRVQRAGHNNLFVHAIVPYFRAIGDLFKHHTPSAA
jgi:uncharacterized protein